MLFGKWFWWEKWPDGRIKNSVGHAVYDGCVGYTDGRVFICKNTST